MVGGVEIKRAQEMVLDSLRRRLISRERWDTIRLMEQENQRYYGLQRAYGTGYDVTYWRSKRAQDVADIRGWIAAMRILDVEVY